MDICYLNNNIYMPISLSNSIDVVANSAAIIQLEETIGVAEELNNAEVQFSTLSLLMDNMF